jgi:hypothetical protein
MKRFANFACILLVLFTSTVAIFEFIVIHDMAGDLRTQISINQEQEILLSECIQDHIILKGN